MDTNQQTTQTEGLRHGAVGMWDLVFFVVAAAAPLSVMSGVSPLAIGFGGVQAPGGYLTGGIVMAVFAVGFTTMSRYVPNAGAFYAYIGQGLGRTVGVGAAFVALVSYVSIAISFIPALGVFAHDTFDSLFGIDLPWGVWAVIGGVLVAALGYLNVTLSAKVLGLLLGLEVLILLVFAVPVLLQGGEEGLSFDSFNLVDMFGPGVGALFVLSFGAFLGFESTAIYSEEARDRRRTVARATYVAVGFLAVFYTIVVWAVIMAYGPNDAVAEANADPTNMVFTATEEWVGAPAADMMRILIVTSTLAAALAFHNASSRYIHALAREGVLPRVGATTNAKTGSPSLASLFVSALALVVILVFAAFGADPYLNTFLWLNGIGIPGIIALQVLCSAAIVAFFARDSRGVHVVKRLIAPLVATIALAVALTLIAKNLDLLTGAETAVNVALMSITPAAFVIGVLVALRIRRTDPEAYGGLTTTEVEST
ncbi:APC family permease [Solicola gregarius]|uniref:APC family permease n=1 Tax=Solicola gregarius TaxID=2908642 RepID=A0AA46TE69_9ACTN|nr:APC family permease [Solicola gregarius]UYM03485.1 APC family permease [Solicola gregarius]